MPGGIEPRCTLLTSTSDRGRGNRRRMPNRKPPGLPVEHCVMKGKERMPELPEVETIRRDLQGEVVGRKIKNVEVRNGSTVRRHPSAKHFRARLDRGGATARRSSPCLWEWFLFRPLLSAAAPPFPIWRIWDLTRSKT